MVARIHGLGPRGLKRARAMPSKSVSSFGLLGLLDWAVVAAYAGGLIVLGLLMSKRRIAPVDYFLASRATSWPVIGLALLASNMSSTALVGLAGGAYALGVSVYDYEWSAIVILVFFCMFLLPSIIRSQTFTMPEFLERRYDGRVRLHFALLTLFLNIVVDSAGVLYSGSLVCQLLFPGWPLWLIVALLAGTAGLYTTLGGLRAVIYIEAVQAVVLMLGALMISIGAFSRAGGWHAVMRGVDPAAISLIRPIGDHAVPEAAAARPRVSEPDPATSARRNRGLGGRGIRCGDDGVDRLDAQFGLDPDHHGRHQAIQAQPVGRRDRAHRAREHRRSAGGRRSLGSPAAAVSVALARSAGRAGLCGVAGGRAISVGDVLARRQRRRRRGDHGSGLALRLRSLHDQRGVSLDAFSFSVRGADSHRARRGNPGQRQFAQSRTGVHR